MYLQEEFPQLDTWMSGVRFAPFFQPVLSDRRVRFELLAQCTQHGRRLEGDVVFCKADEEKLTEFLYQQIRWLGELLAVWRTRNHIIPTVSVNVSPLTILNDSELPEVVGKALRDNPIDTYQLMLEVVEKPFVDLEKVFSALCDSITMLRDTGVGISLDDCGAQGNNTTDIVRRLSQRHLVDEIKVDARRVSGADFVQLVRLADAAGCPLIAEGVEDWSFAADVQSYGCGIQGYMISPPLALHEAPEWLLNQQDRAKRAVST